MLGPIKSVIGVVSRGLGLEGSCSSLPAKEKTKAVAEERIPKTDLSVKKAPGFWKTTREILDDAAGVNRQSNEEDEEVENSSPAPEATKPIYIWSRLANGSIKTYELGNREAKYRAKITAVQTAVVRALGTVYPGLSDSLESFSIVDFKTRQASYSIKDADGKIITYEIDLREYCQDPDSPIEKAIQELINVHQEVCQESLIRENAQENSIDADIDIDLTNKKYSYSAMGKLHTNNFSPKLIETLAKRERVIADMRQMNKDPEFLNTSTFLLTGPAEGCHMRTRAALSQELNTDQKIEKTWKETLKFWETKPPNPNLHRESLEAYGRDLGEVENRASSSKNTRRDEIANEINEELQLESLKEALTDMGASSLLERGTDIAKLKVLCKALESSIEKDLEIEDKEDVETLSLSGLELYKRRLESTAEHNGVDIKKASAVSPSKALERKEQLSRLKIRWEDFEREKRVEVFKASLKASGKTEEELEDLLKQGQQEAYLAGFAQELTKEIEKENNIEGKPVLSTLRLEGLRAHVEELKAIADRLGIEHDQEKFVAHSSFVHERQLQVLQESFPDVEAPKQQALDMKSLERAALVELLKKLKVFLETIKGSDGAPDEGAKQMADLIGEGNCSPESNEAAVQEEQIIWMRNQLIALNLRKDPKGKALQEKIEIGKQLEEISAKFPLLVQLTALPSAQAFKKLSLPTLEAFNAITEEDEKRKVFQTFKDAADACIQEIGALYDREHAKQRSSMEDTAYAEQVKNQYLLDCLGFLAPQGDLGAGFLDLYSRGYVKEHPGTLIRGPGMQKLAKNFRELELIKQDVPKDESSDIQRGWTEDDIREFNWGAFQAIRPAGVRTAATVNQKEKELKKLRINQTVEALKSLLNDVWSTDSEGRVFRGLITEIVAEHKKVKDLSGADSGWDSLANKIKVFEGKLNAPGYGRKEQKDLKGNKYKLHEKYGSYLAARGVPVLTDKGDYKANFEPSKEEKEDTDFETLSEDGSVDWTTRTSFSE